MVSISFTSKALASLAKRSKEYFDTIENEKIPKDMIDLAVHIVELPEGEDPDTYLKAFDALSANPMHQLIVGDIQGRVVATATTDKDGRWSISAKQGPYLVRLRDGERKLRAHVGVEPGVAPVAVGGDRDAEPGRLVDAHHASASTTRRGLEQHRVAELGGNRDGRVAGVDSVGTGAHGNLSFTAMLTRTPSA